MCRLLYFLQFLNIMVFGEVAPGAAHLGRGSILLNRWRQGAGVGVGGWRLNIVVAEAAEERAEDAAAPLLL